MHQYGQKSYHGFGIGSRRGHLVALCGDGADRSLERCCDTNHRDAEGRQVICDREILKDANSVERGFCWNHLAAPPPPGSMVDIP